MKARVTIKLTDSELALDVRRGLGFQAICAQQKSPIEFGCREADCGICSFKVLAGGENLSKPQLAERDFLQAIRADPDERLACQTRVLGDVSILIGYL